MNPRRPDHYLALAGLTVTTAGRLHFDEHTPVLTTAGDPASTAARAAQRVFDVLGPGGEIPDHIRSAPLLVAPDTVAEQDAAVTAGWATEWDWSHIVNFSATTTSGDKFSPHHLIFNYKDGAIGPSALSKMWDPTCARTYLGPKPTVADIVNWLADEIQAVLEGAEPTVVVRTTSIGAFSPGDVKTNVSDGSGAKAVAALVDTLALMALPAFLPQARNRQVTGGGWVLRWQLNPHPMTTTGLAALQRTTVPGLPTYETAIRSVGKGYRRLDFESTKELTC